MAKLVVTDEQILTVVILLKSLFGSSNKNLKKLLEKIDTPSEIAKIRDAVQSLVDLVNSL